MRYATTITNPGIAGIPLDTMFASVAGAGFDAIDVPCEPAMYPAREVMETVASWGSKLPVAEITACINPSRDLVHPDETIRHAAVTYIKQCINLARDTGVNLTHFCFITSLDTLASTPRHVLERRAVESIRACLAFAVDAGVRLLIEPLFKDDVSIVNTTAQAVALYSRAAGIDEATFGKDDQTGLLLDIFHAHVEEDDITAAIAARAPVTHHVHVADHLRGLDFSRPDSGFVAKTLNQLDVLDYAGHASFESFDAGMTLDGLGRALATLKDQVHS